MEPFTAGGLEVRSYNFPLVERIVLTERVAYVTYDRSDQHGWDALVRNGVRAKTVLTDVGSIEITVPRRQFRAADRQDARVG